MAYKDILKIPYVTFVIGMADAPGVDYDKKKKDKTKKPKDAGEEMAAFAGLLS